MAEFQLKPSAAIAATALLLAGCSTSGLLNMVSGGKVSGNASSVTVSDMSDVASALPFAMLHCSRYNRSAQFDRTTSKGKRFRCVT